MKIKTLILALSLICFGLSAQVDKTAVTTDFINGWATDEKHETLMEHFSPNMVFTWPGGGNWPDGNDESLKQFWGFYTQHCKRYKARIIDLEVRELDNESYAFFSWEATVLVDEENPDFVGTTAIGPGTYRLIWEGDKIKHLEFYADSGGRQAQHEKQAAEKKK